MIINVGTENKSKLRAVQAAFKHYFTDFEVRAVPVESVVSAQPQGLDEITRGAKHRAKAAFTDCDLSVGIESGIFKFPRTHSGFMDTSCCAIYDGDKVYLGASPLFEHPVHVIEKLLKDNTEIATVFKEMGYGGDTLRHDEGAIGFLTKGKITREKITEIGLLMALAQIINKECYFPQAQPAEKDTSL